jgi:hypothetical protein
MKDYATSLIITAPSPATSGTSLTVQSGHGDRFPDAPFLASVHPALYLPDLDNAEKVRVTAKVGDVFTIERALSPTTAKTVQAGYRISNTLFADDIAELGAVDSVNGQTGDVVLDTDDVSDSGATNKYVTSAEKTKLSNLSGTNTGDQDLSGLVPNTRTINGHALSSNVTITKADIGLGNVDNISDIDKPVSDATQTALDSKVDKNTLVNNVKDYGALGDDNADDTTAIQDALSGGNVHVYIPDGTYRVYDYIRIEQNTTIEMHPNTVIKNHIEHGDSDDSVVFLNGVRNDTTYSSGYSGDGNITIIGGTIDSSPLSATGKNTQAIAFAHAENVFIYNVRFINNQYNHQIELNSTKHAIVSGCTFDTTTLIAPGTREFINIDYAYAGGFPHFGSYDDTVCEDITIENNTFVDGDISVGSHIATSTFESHRAIKFRDNYVENMANAGIGARYWTLSDVSGNTFKNCGNLGVQTLGLSDSNISDNKIIGGCATYGISLINATGFPCSGNLVSENNLSNITGKGIYTQSSDNTSIMGNILRTIGQESIYINSGAASVVISHNTVISASQSGNGLYPAIFVNGTAVTSTGNLLSHGDSLVEYSYGFSIGSASVDFTTFDDVVENGSSGRYTYNSSSSPRPHVLGAGANNSVTVSNGGDDKIVLSASTGRTNSGIVRVTGTLSASSTEQYGRYDSPTIAQTSTASYVADLVNVTETSTGSGTKLLLDRRVGGISKFAVDNTGAVTGLSFTGSGTGLIDIPQSAVTSLTSDLSARVLKAGDTMTGALSNTLATGNSLVWDTSTLIVDATNHRVAVGTTSPTIKFHVVNGGVSSALGSTPSTRGMAITGADGSSRLYFESTTATSGRRVFVVNNEAGQLNMSSLNDTGSSFVSANVLSIGYNGLIGVNTALPTHTLTLASAGTGIALYNTVDQTTNYERGTLAFASNQLELRTGGGGTGLGRDIFMQASSAANLRIRFAQSTTQGSFTLNRDLTTADAIHTHINGTHTQSSGSVTQLNVQPSITQTSTAGYTALSVNAIENTTGSGTKLLANFKVGGSSKLSISNTGLLTLTDTANMAFGTTTGTKIATATTQKLGFWNTTPIVQPTTAVAAATFVSNTSGTLNDTATFDGYTIGQVVKALRNAGLLA